MGVTKLGDLFAERQEVNFEFFKDKAIAFDGNEVQKRSYPNSHRGDFATRGYEFIEEMKMLDHVDRVREEAIQLILL